MSFLGLGAKKGDIVVGYNPAQYNIEGKEASKPYKFVQSAEMEIIGGDYFDRVFIIVTPESKAAHFETLEKEMMTLGVKEVVSIDIENDLAPESQWKWFEQVLSSIDPGDELTIDLTHGFRIGPIIISTAINFLQKSKNILLKHVWYGAYEKDNLNPPIIDMKDFYIINEWADAVSRLVEYADATKLGNVASSGNIPDFQLGNLGDYHLVEAFKDLTDAVKNVEIHKIGEKTSKALALIKEKMSNASTTGKILLDLVNDKFAILAAGEPASGKYDRAYFELQLEIIKILIEHKLFMQAYTVMREFIGSIGIIKIEKANTTNKEGRRQRRRADVFVNMLQYNENSWSKTDPEIQKLQPFYNKLKTIGVEQILKNFCNDLVGYRNGFDHAWTSKPEAFADIEKKAGLFFNNLKDVVGILVSNVVIS
jgi:hypothetical protein